MRNKVIHMTIELIDVSLHLENNIIIKLDYITMATPVGNSANSIRDVISTLSLLFILIQTVTKKLAQQ